MIDLSKYKISIDMDDDFNHIGVCDYPVFKVTGDSYKDAYNQIVSRLYQYEAEQFLVIINAVLDGLDAERMVQTPLCVSTVFCRHSLPVFYYLFVAGHV